MRAILRDIRFGARSLRNSPALSLIAVLALTLGIGLTTAMFSIVYGILLKGVPFTEGDRIVIVQRENPSRGWTRMGSPIHDYRAYVEQQRSFEGLAAHSGGTVNVSGAERAERFIAGFVSANTFELLDVRPLLGRTFRPGEDAPGAERVAVISFAMWRDRYARDPGIIGKAIRVDGLPATVVGVMPETFGFLDAATIWMPMRLDPLTIPWGEGAWMEVWGRLRPGATIESATRDLAAIASRLASEHKATNEGITAVVRPFVEGDLGPRPFKLLFTMFGAVSFVLLIACANVANLLLARAAHRAKEIGIRTALGASRLAVVRQFLTEALVLAVVGAAGGLGVAYAGITAFNSIITVMDDTPPFFIDIALHPPVLLFVVGLTVLASLVSGVIPAIQSARADITEILKDESRGASSFRIGRLSRGLVIFEIALSCGLLVAAGLMIKSVAKLNTLDPKFATRNIFTARVSLPAAYDTVKQAAFYDDLERALAALPSVTGVSLGGQLPGTGANRTAFEVEGVTYPASRDLPRTSFLTLTPGFFQTFAVQPSLGRAFGVEDRAGSLPVVMVSRVVAERYFNGQDPIGRRVRFAGGKQQQPWLTIIGVVPDIFSGDFERPLVEMMYRPFAQARSAYVSLAVRTEGPPLAITRTVRDVVSAIDPDIPIYSVYTMADAMTRDTWFLRVFGTMFTIFGIAALFLSALGLYAVMAFSVSRRTRDIGIRVAIGAQTSQVLRMIVGQGLTQLAIGMALGLVFAAGLSQLLQGILFDVPPRDPTVFASVVAVLTVSGLLASVIPARRATRIDPMVALRDHH